MDAIDFVIKWNRICEERDGNCCDCPVEETCSSFRTNEMSRKVAKELVYTVEHTNILEKWNRITSKDVKYPYYSYRCSRCDYPINTKPNYCPHCGAKMENASFFCDDEDEQTESEDQNGQS